MIKYTYSAEYESHAIGTVLAGHFNEPDTYVTKRPQGRDDWLIVYTLGGEGFCQTPEGEQVCKAGDILLLRPHTPQQYGTRKEQHWHFLWTHFPDWLTETSLLPKKEILIYPIDNISIQKRIYQLFKNIISDSIERKAFWHELCICSLREVLLLLAQRIDRRIDPRIEDVMHLLSGKLRETIRIDDLAQAVSLSVSRLSHLFKEQTGHSIVEELNRMRIQQAAMLLVHSHRSASEIALDVGYQNYNHFANQFNAQFGVSPSEYRKLKPLIRNPVPDK
jgi:AraC family transcriptional regulator of arabinose operon